jgi:hypothetical protein
MRLDRHNGVVFRDGPAGRRAVVVGGPDVWEVIMAARGAPERGEELIRELAERLGVPSEKIRIAIRYYAEYPEEVDRNALSPLVAGRLAGAGHDAIHVLEFDMHFVQPCPKKDEIATVFCYGSRRDDDSIRG